MLSSTPRRRAQVKVLAPEDKVAAPPASAPAATAAEPTTAAATAAEPAAAATTADEPAKTEG